MAGESIQATIITTPSHPGSNSRVYGGPYLYNTGNGMSGWR
jgi:hypothetical protein